MQHYIPSDINNDLEYIDKVNSAQAQPTWRERQEAYLVIREHYLALAEKTEAIRWDIKDPDHWKHEKTQPDRYIKSVLMHNILNSADSTSCHKDVADLHNISLCLQIKSGDRYNPRQRLITRKFQEAKFALNCVSMIPQTMVDLLHRATLGHYDPKKSIQQNKEEAAQWIKQKRAMLDKPSATRTFQPQ